MLSLDMGDLEKAVAVAPGYAVAVSEQARKTERRTSGGLKDRLRTAAVKALDDLEEMLEPEELPDGQVRSKVSENTRAKLNMWLVEMNPDIQEERNRTPPIKIELSVGSVESARNSAQFARASVTTDGEQKQIESGWLIP